MKKLLLSLFIVLCSLARSQTYHPILDSVNEWRYTADMIGVRLAHQVSSVNTPCFGYPYFFFESAVQYTNGDTMINSTVYKKLVMGEPNWGYYCLYGFVREDTASRKVYFLDTQNNPEILMYDFSMQIGDTIVENFLGSGGYFMNGNYILDSIGSMTIDAGVRSVYYLNNPTGGHTLWWVESVGHPGFFVYPYAQNNSSYVHYMNCQETPHDFYELLTCFHHQGRVYYDSCAYHTAMMDGCIMVQDTCNYWNICGSVKEIKSLYSLELVPNPATNRTTMKMEITKNLDPEFFIYDATGRKLIRSFRTGILQSGQHDIDVDLEGISPGFYLVEIRTEEGAGFVKLIVN